MTFLNWADLTFGGVDKEGFAAALSGTAPPTISSVMDDLLTM